VSESTGDPGDVGAYSSRTAFTTACVNDDDEAIATIREGSKLMVENLLIDVKNISSSVFALNS
jgi:hypothetical protein